jgi:hypothetical protein
LNGHLRRLAEALGTPETEAKQVEERRMSETRARIIVDLERAEARWRSMSAAALAAWRRSPEGQAEIRELEEAIERKRGGKPTPTI